MPKLSNEQYDVAKDCVTIYAPAVGVAVAAIGTLWGVDPDLLTKIVGTLTALTTLAGALLKVSTNQYRKEEETK